MPRDICDVFEWDWPWLMDEAAEEKVVEGVHTISLNKIREVAARMGYEESYYAQACDSITGKIMETLAFCKTHDGGVIQKLLYYPRRAAASIAIFQPNYPSGKKASFLPVVEGCDNFWEDCLGIVAPNEENGDFSKLDALFNPHSLKTLVLFPSVESLEVWESVLAKSALLSCGLF